jgi:hypothetical protein
LNAFSGGVGEGIFNEFGSGEGLKCLNWDLLGLER